MKHSLLFLGVASLLLCEACTSTSAPEQNGVAKNDSATNSSVAEQKQSSENPVCFNIKAIKAFNSAGQSVGVSEFQYNSYGQITAIKSGDISFSLSYSRNKADSVIMVSGKGGESVQSYSNGVLKGDEEFDTEVKNGKVWSYKGREFGYAVEYKWADGNMTNKTTYDEESVIAYNYTYGELQNQWKFDLIGFLDVFDKKTNKEYLNSAYVTSEYLSKNLPVAIDYSFEEEDSESIKEKCQIKYEIDSKNRVQKIIVDTNGKGIKSFEVEYAE